MNTIDQYCELVIKPLEQEQKRLLEKICTRNIADWLFRKVYIKHLYNIEEKINASYRKIEIMVEEEVEMKKNDKV